MSADEQAIRALIATWLSASKEGDAAKVLSLMTDDVLFLTAGNPPMTKAAFENAQSALGRFHMEAESQVQEVQIMGDWAYTRTHLTVTMTPKAGGGTPMKRAGHTLSILRKQNGKWLMFRDANLLVPRS